jgi:hypothetical protein
VRQGKLALDLAVHKEYPIGQYEHLRAQLASLWAKIYSSAFALGRFEEAFTAMRAEQRVIEEASSDRSSQAETEVEEEGQMAVDGSSPAEREADKKRALVSDSTSRR